MVVCYNLSTFQMDLSVLFAQWFGIVQNNLKCFWNVFEITWNVSEIIWISSEIIWNVSEIIWMVWNVSEIIWNVFESFFHLSPWITLMEVLIGMIGTQQRPGNTNEIRLYIPAVQGKMFKKYPNVRNNVLGKPHRINLWSKL